ncbi:MAG: hypothetical protein ACK4VW_01160 [Anaerolineales bacterium]
MRFWRYLGVILFALLGGALTLLSVGGALATWQQTYEAGWIFLFGLPLAAIFLGISWALGSRRRVRVVAGVLVTVAALFYEFLFVSLAVGGSWAAINSPSLLAGLALLPAVWVWPIPLLFILIGGWLLWKQKIPLASFLMSAIALIGSLGWLAFEAILLFERFEQMRASSVIGRSEQFAQQPSILELIATLNGGAVGFSSLFFLLPVMFAIFFAIRGIKR